MCHHFTRKTHRSRDQTTFGRQGAKDRDERQRNRWFTVEGRNQKGVFDVVIFTATLGGKELLGFHGAENMLALVLGVQRGEERIVS